MGKKLSAYNLYMRKALKGKMAGKTKAQRKAIFKAAARGWNKGKPRSTPRSKPKSGGSSRSTSRRSSNTTGGRRVGKGFNTQKLFSLLRLASLVLPGAVVATGPGTPTYKLQKGASVYTGIGADGQFRFSELRKGYEGYFWTSLATYGIPKVISFVKKVLG